MTFISETNWSLLKKLLTKNLGYIFGVWRMLHPTRTEVIPEVFLKPRATREDVLEDCWQVWREGLCILCCFLTLWELVPGYMYVFEVCTGSLGYESLTAKWIPKPWEHGPNHGPRAVPNAGHCVQNAGHCLQSGAIGKRSTLAQWQGSQWFGQKHYDTIVI